MLVRLRDYAKILRRHTTYEEISGEDIHKFQLLVADLVAAAGNPWMDADEHDLLFALGEIVARRQSTFIAADQLACFLAGVYAVGKAVGKELSHGDDRTKP